MSRIVSKAELARLLDLSRPAISAYLRRGMPEEADGRLDEGKCREWIRQNVRVQAGLRGEGGRMAAGEDAAYTGQGLLDAKRVRATFMALLAEHRAQRLIGSVAPLAGATDVVAAELAVVRERLRQIPAWASPRLVDVDTPQVAQSIIHKTICGALHDLSKKDDEPAWNGCIDEKPIPADEGKISHVTCDGEIIYVRVAKEEPPQPEEPKKPKRRRSIAPVEEAIAEEGAESDVENELLVAVERAVRTMTLTEAKTRFEIAEGLAKRGGVRPASEGHRS